ncbi:MAG: hypothetical protein U9R19_16810 [Bacteroidota bacterium]|nr:hypothetical protein [Bacteroidota bacterium]
MRKSRLLQLSAVFILISLFSSCATFKSDMIGKYDQSGEKNYNAQAVEVLFLFSHYRQTKGFDAIPMLDRRPISGFNDIFIDAMNEFSNIDNYSTFTDLSSDVDKPKRRKEKDSLMHSNDYIIKVKFLKEKSFAKHFFATIGSVISATILPMPYKYDYTATIDVFNSEQKLIKSYTRKMYLKKWWQTFMLFLYPFNHEKRKKELLYVEILHDMFKQIESEKILK